MRARNAFTLIELLVVVAIIALLVSMLLPCLARAKEVARTAKCLANMHGMGIAQAMYYNDNEGKLIMAGLGHDGTCASDYPWIKTLQAYYGNELIARCPSDRSRHWKPPGVPVTDVYGNPVYLTDASGNYVLDASGQKQFQYRLCSYGINEYTDSELWTGFGIPPPYPYPTIDSYPRPASVVHFVEMAQDGHFAGADHPHIDLWRDYLPDSSKLEKVSDQLQINEHGGLLRTWDARANYGFLDGHALTLPFESVFIDSQRNKFDPAVAN